MKISDLELNLVEVPRSGPNPPVVSLLVRLATDLGLEGWGEAYVPWRPSELEARRELLLATLSGRSPFDIADLCELATLAFSPLRCAVEMACWDLIGRHVGQPICNLLGGVFRKRTPLAARLPAGPVQHVVQAARELAEVGFRCLVLSTSGSAEEDAETLAQLRDALEERAELRLDAQRRLAFDEAQALAEALPRGSVQYWLDPLAEGNLERLRSLAQQASVPLAVGMPLRSPADVFALARAGAAGFVVMEIESLGGVSGARAATAIAVAAGIGVSLAGRPCLGIGTALALQLVAATPGLASANDWAYPQLRDDVLTEPLRVLDGMLEVPQSPGLGVEIDRAKIERYLLA